MLSLHKLISEPWLRRTRKRPVWMLRPERALHRERRLLWISRVLRRLCQLHLQFRIDPALLLISDLAINQKRDQQGNRSVR